MRSIRTAVLLVAALGVAGCATSPTGRDQLIMFSPSVMRDMGAAAFNEIKDETPAAGAYLNRYVECVADAIVAVLPDGQSQGWEVEVFDEDEPNAFALPGKKIGVYKGLLDVTERQDQLAAVIGHEIGHVLARHGNERMSSQFVVGAGLAVAEAMMRRPESNEGRLTMAVLGLGAGGNSAALQPQPRERGGPDRAGAHGPGGIRPRGERGAVEEHVPSGGRAATGVAVHAPRERDSDQGVADADSGRSEGLPEGEGGGPGAGLRWVMGGWVR